MSRPIPVIDLFAGPGGLGEGFSASSTASGASAFKIALSIEKDPIAHQTLTLRSFFRQFPAGDVPDEYYHRLQRKLTTSDLFNCFPEQARAAQEEAWQATLGDERNTAELRSRVRHALNGQDPWVLIGGPPCQAYSLAGRSRNKGIKDYVFAEDPRTKLYIEYLQLIADFWPAVFVMENVKGLLSARLDGQSVFDQITRDLSDPAAALSRLNRPRARGSRHFYTLHAVTQSGPDSSPADFLIRSEQFGIHSDKAVVACGLSSQAA